MSLSGQVGRGEKLSRGKKPASRLDWHAGARNYIMAAAVSAITDSRPPGSSNFRRRD